MNNYYDKLNLNSVEIDAEGYKEHLGGGTEHWEQRGAFQVQLMRFFGLQAESSLLDVGCGPLRGGIHLLKYLDSGLYRGVDYNSSFIEAAHTTLIKMGQSDYVKQISLLRDFDFQRLNRKFDFVLCFSVLNHCSEADRKLFFERVKSVMKNDTRLIVTHGDWFDSKKYDWSSLEVVRVVKSEKDLGLKFKEWGFEDGAGDRLPILEFRIKS